MSDDEDNLVSKKFSTPENKSKSKSKFEDFMDDIESKNRPKSFIKNNKEEPNTNNNSNYNSNNSEFNTSDKKIENSSNSTTLNNDSSSLIKNISNFLSPDDNATSLKSKKINNNLNKLRKFNSFNIIPKKNQKKSDIKNNKSPKISSFISPRSDKENTIQNRANSAKINQTENHDKIRHSTPGSGLRNPKTKVNETNNTKFSLRINKIANLTPPIINLSPRIFDDPLDDFKEQIESMLEKSNDDIGLLSNKISMIDLEMETEISKMHRDYAKNLRNLYVEKEKKLREIYSKFNYELYKLSQDKNDKYDEMNKKKNDEILETEKNFNEMKNNLKNSLHVRIELVRKNCETKRKEVLNNDVIKEIRQKIFDMLNIKETEINAEEKKEKFNQLRKKRNSIYKK